MDGLGLRDGEDWRSNRVVLSEICHHLDVDSILQVRLVNRTWYEASKPALHKKAVIKVNRPTPLIDEIDWIPIWGSSDGDNHMTAFHRFASFVTNFDVYKFENLELSWCPLMKNHPIWLKVAPNVKNLVVCKLHASDLCFPCGDEQFLLEVLTVFQNVTTLSLKDHLPQFTVCETFRDFFVKKKAAGELPMINSETLKSLHISAEIDTLPTTLINSLIPHLECLELLSPKYEFGWRHFFESLTVILNSVESKRFKKLGIRCKLKPDLSGIETLKELFTKFPADSVLVWIVDRTTETIRQLHDRWFPLPAKDVSFVFDVKEAGQGHLNCVLRGHLEQMAWNKNKASHRLTLSKRNDVYGTTIWKRVSTESHVATLLVSSELKLNDEKMMEVMPDATFLVICRAGRVVAEIFGPSNLLFPNFEHLLDSLTRVDVPENKSHLVDMLEFRRFVGISDNWYPSELTEKLGKYVLVFFAIDSRRIDEARVKVSNFIHPARKLESTFQIVRGFRQGCDYFGQGKAILNWTDPICLRLASGESVIEESDYKVLKA